MTVEQAVVDRLRTTAGVSALVGTRVYQLLLPQQPTLPAIRVQLIDEPRWYHLRGESAVTRARVQVDVFEAATIAAPYVSAAAVADAVDAALSGQVFTDGSPTTLEVVGVFRQDRQVLYEADELRLVRVLQDYWVLSRTVN